jgi:hypothetical protein
MRLRHGDSHFIAISHSARLSQLSPPVPSGDGAGFDSSLRRAECEIAIKRESVVVTSSTRSVNSITNANPA